MILTVCIDAAERFKLLEVCQNSVSLTLAGNPKKCHLPLAYEKNTYKHKSIIRITPEQFTCKNLRVTAPPCSSAGGLRAARRAARGPRARQAAADHRPKPGPRCKE